MLCPLYGNVIVWWRYGSSWLVSLTFSLGYSVEKKRRRHFSLSFDPSTVNGISRLSCSSSAVRLSRHADWQSDPVAIRSRTWRRQLATRKHRQPTASTQPFRRWLRFDMSIDLRLMSSFDSGNLFLSLQYSDDFLFNRNHPHPIGNPRVRPSIASRLIICYFSSYLTWDLYVFVNKLTGSFIHSNQ